MNFFQTVYQMAKEGTLLRNVATIEELKKTHPITEIDKKTGLTIIEKLASENYQKECELLIRLGADINDAVFSAAAHDHSALVKTLLKKGADINRAVLGAAFGDHRALGETLLKRGADINMVVYDVALDDHRALVETPLEKGADINKAVMSAARNNNQALVETLLKKGADIDRAVFSAAMNNNQALVEILLKKGADINTAVFSAAFGDHQALVKTLLKKGADINKAVLGAKTGNHPSLIKELLSTIDNGISDRAPKKNQEPFRATQTDSDDEDFLNTQTENFCNAKEIAYASSFWQKPQDAKPGTRVISRDVFNGKEGRHAAEFMHTLCATRKSEDIILTKETVTVRLLVRQ